MVIPALHPKYSQERQCSLLEPNRGSLLFSDPPVELNSTPFQIHTLSTTPLYIAKTLEPIMPVKIYYIQKVKVKFFLMFQLPLINSKGARTFSIF